MRFKIDDTLESIAGRDSFRNRSAQLEESEVGRRFTTDDKIGLVDEQTLIVGADIGKNEHLTRIQQI